MAVTPRAPRRIKRTTGYKMPADIERDLNALVASGEFANRADIQTAAIRSWLQYRHFDVKNAVREYLQSEEGRRLIVEIIKKRTPKK